MKIVELFKMIEMEGSSLIKDQIVKENLNSFKDTLKSIYEDCYGSQKYFIKKAPITSNYGTFTIDTSYNTFSLALKDLAERKITGNNALNYIANIISLYTKEDQEWLIRILMKDLKIGYSKTSWEKIFGKGEEEYTVSLALKNVIHYGKVSFADVYVGSIVKVVDCDDNVTVGIVEEKIEAIGKKYVKVRMGFEDTISILIEEESCDNRLPYCQLVNIIRSYV